jgi:hypothetical protein
MIRYIGSDEYEVKVGSIDGVFSQEDLVDLVDELTDVNKKEIFYYTMYDKYLYIIEDS